MHPMKQIELMAGWVVDGITTTYRLSDGSVKVIPRGTPLTKTSPNYKSIVLSGGLSV
jgi:hypothetical protein